MWFEEVERLLAARPVRRRPPIEGQTASAVLVPLYVAGGSLWVVVTRRTNSLPNHGGQYAFPGGVRQDGDEDEVATALREAGEELGVDSSVVLVLGQLDDVWTQTGFVISPVVGALPYPLALQPSAEEVEAVVPVPFRLMWGSASHGSPSPDYGSRKPTTPSATALIISDLVCRLSGVPVAPVE